MQIKKPNKALKLTKFQLKKAMKTISSKLITLTKKLRQVSRHHPFWLMIKEDSQNCLPIIRILTIRMNIGTFICRTSNFWLKLTKFQTLEMTYSVKLIWSKVSMTKILTNFRMKDIAPAEKSTIEGVPMI
jgi:hypothetical protein